LAAFADAFNAVKHHVGETGLVSNDLRARLDQLGRSYSKTLHDMRMDPHVTVGRSSWDEASDYDTEQTHYLGPVPMRAEMEEELEAIGEGEIDEAFVRRLGINPRENLRPDHNRREFWIEDFGARYYHRYILFENDRKTETDWMPVSEAFFEEHEDHLGMDIVTKPYGYYEDEAIKVAAPPGLAYVGNPHYGSWRRGSDGVEFWQWLPAYMFFNSMFGGNRYTRRDYQYWNGTFRGRRPWYGLHPGDPQEEEEQYGSGSGRVIRYYGNSDWSRTGGFRRQDGSVRGAGRSFRGGGPGGSGK
jgi:hypothetical protein